MVFSILLANEEHTAPSPTDDFWYQPVGQSRAGYVITAHTAMKVSALYACVRVMAGTIASLPKDIMRRTPNGVEPAPEHELQYIIDRKPNAWQTSFEFWYQQIAYSMLFGNMYAKRISDGTSYVTELQPMLPTDVQVMQLPSGRKRYKYKNPLTGGKQEMLSHDQVLHIPSFSFGGTEGIAPLLFANDAVGLAVACETFGSDFFSKNATPAVALEYPGKLKDENARKNIINSWKRMHVGGKNNFSVALLEEGMKIQQLTVANKDSQYLETRRHQIAEICRFYGIPLHMVNDLEKSSFNNIQEQSIEFVKNTVRPVCYQIEQRINTELIVDDATYYVKHDFNELLKGEMKNRYDAFNSAVNTGWMTRNEVRRRENMNPLPGLDDPLTPLNMGVGSQPTENDDNVFAPIIDDIAERCAHYECEKTKSILNKKDSEDFAQKVVDASESIGTYFYNAVKPLALAIDSHDDGAIAIGESRVESFLLLAKGDIEMPKSPEVFKATTKQEIVALLQTLFQGESDGTCGTRTN